MERPLELACDIGSIDVRRIRGHMGSYCRQPSFPPTPKMILPLTSKSLSMRIASGFPSLLTIRPRSAQPANPPSGMSVCGPTRDIQSPKLLCCISCSAELQNAKYSRQRAEIIFKRDRRQGGVAKPDLARDVGRSALMSKAGARAMPGPASGGWRRDRRAVAGVVDG